MDSRFTTFTLLREPVERTLKPLEEIYEERLRFHGFAHNHAFDVEPYEFAREMLARGALETRPRC